MNTDFVFVLIVGMAIGLYFFNRYKKQKHVNGLIAEAEKGSEPAMSKLIQLDLAGKNGVLLVCEPHSEFAVNGSRHPVVRYPDHTFLERYARALGEYLHSLAIRIDAANTAHYVTQAEERSGKETVAHDEETRKMVEATRSQVLDLLRMAPAPALQSIGR